jgi:hypothetical protein
VRRKKKNKKDKKSVNLIEFTICGKFTRALPAHQIFYETVKGLKNNPAKNSVAFFQNQVSNIQYLVLVVSTSSTSFKCGAFCIFSSFRKFLNPEKICAKNCQTRFFKTPYVLIWQHYQGNVNRFLFI